MAKPAESETALVFPPLGRVYAGLDAWVLPLLRVLAGVSMVMHGWVHISNDMADNAAYFAGEGYEPALFWAWAVTLTELVGGGLLAIGYLTRLAALPIFIFLLTAVFYHMRNGFYWNEGGFEYPLMWAVVTLVFIVKGGGRASVDALLRKTF
jgi:putative oxidoreductase